jgi:Lysine methyltransferase
VILFVQYAFYISAILILMTQADTTLVIDPHELLSYELQAGPGKRLKVWSDPLSKYGYNVGNGLWTAALELIDFFVNDSNRHADTLNALRVLELGAGLGTVGQVFPASKILF